MLVLGRLTYWLVSVTPTWLPRRSISIRPRRQMTCLRIAFSMLRLLACPPIGAHAWRRLQSSSRERTVTGSRLW